MPDPITTGALIVSVSGAGTWLADKVLGSSAEALGESLRVFLGGRVSKVFLKAEELADRSEAIQQLPPGFLLKFVQSASFSEDDDIITEMWASLLLNSSRQFRQRQVLYLDILDKLSAEDARTLDHLINFCPNAMSSHSTVHILENIRMQCYFVAERILRECDLSYLDGDSANKFNDEVDVMVPHWPAKILGSVVPYTPHVVEGSSSASSNSTGLANSNAPYDALVRQRLVQTFEVSFIAGFSIELEGVMATALGIEFIQNCRGTR